jgi:hypothetical protein
VSVLKRILTKKAMSIWMDLPGSGQVIMAVCCHYGNELLGSANMKHFRRAKRLPAALGISYTL